MWLSVPLQKLGHPLPSYWKLGEKGLLPNVWNNFFLKILFLDEHIQHVRHSPEMEMHLPSSQTINHDVVRPRPKSHKIILATYFEFPDTDSYGFIQGFSYLLLHSNRHCKAQWDASAFTAMNSWHSTPCTFRSELYHLPPLWRLIYPIYLCYANYCRNWARNKCIRLVQFSDCVLLLWSTVAFRFSPSPPRLQPRLSPYSVSVDSSYSMCFIMSQWLPNSLLIAS